MNSEMISPEYCLGCQVANGVLLPVGGFVYADELWTVNHILVPAPILGWLILQPRRHVEALHELTADEQRRMAQLMAYVDSTVRYILAPSKMYVCLFAESAQCPHIHFHVIPRTRDIEVRGPEIFDYRPQAYPSEEKILNFVHQAREHIKRLMGNERQ
jgi:diadenosine tetraphosphate (Ap4A) HIT family hydrolase